MLEKIEWYREVLELEPSSKVFFPLARLLARLERRDEAIAALRQGLERHPEFIEARLYLVELLFQEAAFSECEAHLAKLTGIFTHYPGFWEAWGSCLNKSGKSRDLPLAISFLAAVFQNDGLSVADVLERGLKEYLKAGAAAFAGGEEKNFAPSETCSAPYPEDSDAPAPGLQDECAGAEIFCEPEIHQAPEPPLAEEPAAPETHFVAPPPFAEDFVGAEIHQAPEPLMVEEPLAPDAHFVAAPSFAEDFAAPEFHQELEPPLAEEPAAPESPAARYDGHLPEDAVAFTPSELEMSEEAPVGTEDGMKVMSSAARPLRLLVQNGLCDGSGYEAGQGYAADDDADDDSGDENEEQFSLRTRSMAEVLAEQGDVAGALEIYGELLAAAADAGERGDLQTRIATLSARLGKNYDASPASEENPDTPPPGKHRLMTLLETLADRLEARAQS